MLRTVIRWGIPLSALFLIGPLAGLCTGALRAPDGSSAATPLLSEAPVRGIGAGLVALALAGAMGLLGARLVGARSGLFAAGLVLAWAAWGTGPVDEILRRTQSASTLWTVSLEGVLFGGLGVGLAWAIVLMDGREGPKEDQSSDDGPSPAFGFVVAVIAGAIGAWLIAQESLKGQTFAAAAVAGVLGAFLGRLGSHRTPVPILFVALAILAAAGPLLAMVLHSGDARLMHATYAGRLFPLARPLPLDWVAGAFVGIPVGLNWAASMTEPHHHQESRA